MLARRKSEAFNIAVDELKTPAGVPTSAPIAAVLTLDQLASKLEAAERQRQEKLQEKQTRAASTNRSAKLRSAENRERSSGSTAKLQQKIEQDLEAAAERKNSLISEVQERAGRRVSYVKAIAEREKNEDTNGVKELRDNIEQSLCMAQENHEKYLNEVRARAGQYNDRVRDVAMFKNEDAKLQNQQRLENLEESLIAASAKKDELLEERASRAGSAYYRAKEIATCVREINKIETRRLSRELGNKARSAQYQKEDMERMRQERLQANDRHSEVVRLRRSSMTSSATDLSTDQAASFPAGEEATAEPVA